MRHQGIKSEAPRLSVAIVCKGNAATIGRTLESVRRTSERDCCRGFRVDGWDDRDAGGGGRG